MQQTILWIYEFQFQVFLFNFSSLAESKVNSLRKILILEIPTWFYAHTYNIEISISYILSYYEYILHVPDRQNFVFPARNHIFMSIACYEYKFNINLPQKGTYMHVFFHEIWHLITAQLLFHRKASQLCIEPYSHQRFIKIGTLHGLEKKPI